MLKSNQNYQLENPDPYILTRSDVDSLLAKTEVDGNR